MRKLKGGQPKESSKEKKQRKKEFATMQKQIYTIVIPCFVGIALLIMAYVYVKTRPLRNDYL